MRNFTKLFLLAGFIGVSLLSHAQVGINVDDPNPSAILHIHHDTKGVLFPAIDNLADVGEVNGLFIFRTSDNKFFYYNEDSAAWICMNPFYAEDDYNATLQGNLTIDGGNVTVRGGNIEVEAENTISGYGTIPRGGIIMWSGEHNNIPDGWALCNGDEVEGIQTPDLRGRFVVGYDQSSSDYSSINDTGGEENVTLNEAQIPDHDHEMNHGHGITDPGHSHKIVTGRNGGNGEITKQDAHNSAKKTTESSVTGITVNSFTGKTGVWGSVYHPEESYIDYSGSECRYNTTKTGCTDLSPYKKPYRHVEADACDGTFEPVAGTPEEGPPDQNPECFLYKPECENDDYNPNYGNKVVTQPARYSQDPVEKRPPYYVIAFIIRVK